jgi:hypothetical protein
MKSLKKLEEAWEMNMLITRQQNRSVKKLYRERR